MRQQHWLEKATGIKNEKEAQTQMEKAMGFSRQSLGKPAQGQLAVVRKKNEPISILENEFNPNKPLQTYTSQIFCDDGRCQPVYNITG